MEKLFRKPFTESTKYAGLVVSKCTLTGTYLGKTITVRVAIEEQLTKLFVDVSTVVLNPNRTKTLKVQKRQIGCA